MDNNLTYYEFIYEQAALPEKIIFVVNESSIVRLIIKNCNNKDYDFPTSLFGGINGEFYSSISVSYFTTERCNISNLKIRFPTINKHDDKISPYEITFKEKKPKFFNLAKQESYIEWQKK